MKGNSAFFSVILFIWIGTSTYWYVCKIKKDCEVKKETITISEEGKSSLLIEKDNKEAIIKKVDNVQIKEDFEEELLIGYTVYNFPKNSNANNNIKEEFSVFASKLKNYLSDKSNSKVEIIGYTDNSGSIKTNLSFGKKRAIFIKNKFVEIGIDAKTFIIRTMGEADPISSNETEEGRLKNRRVIIKLTKK